MFQYTLYNEADTTATQHNVPDFVRIVASDLFSFFSVTRKWTRSNQWPLLINCLIEPNGAITIFRTTLADDGNVLTSIKIFLSLREILYKHWRHFSNCYSNFNADEPLAWNHTAHKELAISKSSLRNGEKKKGGGGMTTSDGKPPRLAKPCHSSGAPCLRCVTRGNAR